MTDDGTNTEKIAVIKAVFCHWMYGTLKVKGKSYLA